jgi:hypothetical protein
MNWLMRKTGLPWNTIRHATISWLFKIKKGKKKFLDAIMKQASEKFDAPISYLKSGTIKAMRRSTRNLLCTHPGLLSPMHKVEAHLLKVILLRGTMQQPVSCREGLELANSLIEGTPTQNNLVEWKKARLGKNYREETATKMGQKYWLNFCKRHVREIESTKAVRYDSKRDDWCTLENFEQMYNDVYDMMFKASVAKELD